MREVLRGMRLGRGCGPFGEQTYLWGDAWGALERVFLVVRWRGMGNLENFLVFRIEIIDPVREAR